MWRFHKLAINGTRDLGEPTRNMVHITAAPGQTRFLSTNGSAILGATVPNLNEAADGEWEACIPNDTTFKDFAAAAGRAKPSMFHDALVTFKPPVERLGDTARWALPAAVTDYTNLQVELWLEDVDWPGVAVPAEMIDDNERQPTTGVELPPGLKSLSLAESAADVAGVAADLGFSHAAHGPIAYWREQAKSGIDFCCVVLLK